MEISWSETTNLLADLHGLRIFVGRAGQNAAEEGLSRSAAEEELRKLGLIPDDMPNEQLPISIVTAIISHGQGHMADLPDMFFLVLHGPLNIEPISPITIMHCSHK